MRELVFAGFGGQGVLTAGLIISQIALYKGVNATWMPAYGAAQRGGTANCTVHYGEEKITNPGQQKPDLVEVNGSVSLFLQKGAENEPVLMVPFPTMRLDKILRKCRFCQPRQIHLSIRSHFFSTLIVGCTPYAIRRSV